MCVPPPPYAGRQEKLRIEVASSERWQRRNLRSVARHGERLLKLMLSPLSNHPERRRRTRRWGASPPMRERRKDSIRMHHAPRPWQTPRRNPAAARCYLCVSAETYICRRANSSRRKTNRYRDGINCSCGDRNCCRRKSNCYRDNRNCCRRNRSFYRHDSNRHRCEPVQVLRASFG